MALLITPEIVELIHQHGMAAYPEEGAGLLLGTLEGGAARVAALFEIANAREAGARHNRYLLTPQDYLRGELEADRRGLAVIGVFHSHPDHPNQPSEFDREWAMPGWSYVITSVQAGRAVESRSWRLSEDRQRFDEEIVEVIEESVHGFHGGRG
jgi:proteasome lid subunit RPN8/RPN11